MSGFYRPAQVALCLPVLFLPSEFDGYLSRVFLGVPVLCLPSGFHGSPADLLGCSCTLPTVRVPRISPRVSLGLPLLPLPSGSTGLHQVWFGLLLLSRWSKRSPPGLLQSPPAALDVRNPHDPPSGLLGSPGLLRVSEP